MSTNIASHCFRRQVLHELGPDAATVVKETSDLAPDDTVLLDVVGGRCLFEGFCRRSSNVCRDRSRSRSK